MKKNMRRNTHSGAGGLALLVACVLTLLAQSSLAAEYYAIVDSFGKKARNAYMDVSVDTTLQTAADILFTVFNTQGLQLTEFSVRGNFLGFASTASFGNLFNLTNSLPVLIRARTPDSAGVGAAVLHIDSLGAPTIIGVAPIRRGDGSAFAMGSQFSFALGNFRSASLLIGNVSGADQVVDVHVGTRSADGSGVFSNPRLVNNGIWKVDLTQNQALSNLVITSTGPIIVQAVINDGATIQSFAVMPSQ
jgi:hypothetical protein